MSNMCISILMSVYKNDKPEYLQKSLESLIEQTLIPTEVILVEDGEITEHLSLVIEKFKKQINIKSIRLESNQGLGAALNKGLESCKNEFIARMDADDIALPTRLYEQVNFLKSNKDIDIIGSWIEEFNEDSPKTKVIQYPALHNDILSFFKKRDPVAHPSVMFRRSFFDKAGNYNLYYRKDQDTELWFRAFLNGAKFANIQKPLLKFRLSNKTLEKRQDIPRIFKFLLLRLKINFYLKLGLFSYFYSFSYCLIQLMPRFLTVFLYNRLR